MASNDLLLRITGDSSSAERALARAEAAQRRYDLTVRRAQGEMAASFEKSAAAQAASQQRNLDLLDRSGTAFLGFGAAVGVGLGIAGREAMQWESAWAGVTKTVSGSEASMDALEQGLRDLALVLPASHEEIAAVAEAAGALGVEQPAILGFTRTMIDLGETTDLAAGDAATAIATLAEVMGTDLQNEVDNFGNALVALGNNGASTESQILEMSQRLAVAGNIARLSEADVLGFASALTSVGINAEAGGTAFSKVFVAIDDAVKSGSENLETFAQVSGMSIEEFSRAFREDAAGATTAFVEGLGRMDASGQSLTSTLDELGLGEERTRASLLALAGATGFLAEQVALSNEEYDHGNALVEEAAKRYETTEAKVQLAKNALSDAAITIGESLLPIIAELAQAVGRLSQWFAGLPEPVQKSVTALAGLAAVGGLVAGSSLKMYIGVKKLMDTLNASPAIVNKATGALKGLGAIGGVVGGIAATAVAVNQLIEALDDDKIKSNVTALSTELFRLGETGEVTGELARVVGEDFSVLGEQARAAFEDLKAGDLGDWEGLSDLGTTITSIDEALANMVASGDTEQAAAVIKASGVSAQEAAVFFDQYTLALGDVKVRAEAAGTPVDQFGTIIEDTAGQAEELSPAVQDLADRFGLTGEEAKKAAAELDELDRNLGEIYDKVFSTEEAQDRLSQSMLELTTSIQEQNEAFANGVEGATAFDTALIGNSEAALRNRDTMRELIAENLGIIETWDRSKMTTEEFSTQVDGLKQSFIDSQVANGFAREEVEKYAGAFDLVPTDVPTTFTQHGLAEGLEQAKNMRRELEGLDGFTAHAKVVIDFSIQGLEGVGYGPQPPSGAGDGSPFRTGAPSGPGGGGSSGGMGAQAASTGGGSSSTRTGAGSAERGAMAGTISLPALAIPSSDSRRSGSTGRGSSADQARPERTTNVNLTINNPLNEPTSESIGAEHDLILALAR